MLLERRGELNARLIDAEPGMYSSKLYKYRFGGMLNAYRIIGYQSPRESHCGHARTDGKTLIPLPELRT